MYRDVLQSIAGIEIFPIIGLVIFLAAAAGIIIWVTRLSKDDITRFSRLPLDDEEHRSLTRPTDMGARGHDG